MIITDSLVSLGAILKGRSGSPPILWLLRKMASLVIASGVRIYPIWIESERNHADGPSRDQPIGQAVKEARMPLARSGRSKGPYPKDPEADSSPGGARAMHIDGAIIQSST